MTRARPTRMEEVRGLKAEAESSHAIRMKPATAVQASRAAVSASHTLRVMSRLRRSGAPATRAARAVAPKPRGARPRDHGALPVAVQRAVHLFRARRRRPHATAVRAREAAQPARLLARARSPRTRRRQIAAIVAARYRGEFTWSTCFAPRFIAKLMSLGFLRDGARGRRGPARAAAQDAPRVAVAALRRPPRRALGAQAREAL